MVRLPQRVRDYLGKHSYVCLSCYTPQGEDRDTCTECGGEVIKWDPEVLGPVPAENPNE